MKLKKLISKDTKIKMFEHYILEKLSIDDPGNLHGDERTQRQYVIDLANSNAMGLISLSDIADALNSTRDEVRNSYARIIRHYEDKDDFVKVVPEVRFHSSAIYQLASRAKSNPLSTQQLNQAKSEEEKKYKDTISVYYPIYTYQKGYSNPIVIAYLSLKPGDKVDQYKKMIPAQTEYYGDIMYYKISNIPTKKEPSPDKQIVTSDDIKEFGNKLREN